MKCGTCLFSVSQDGNRIMTDSFPEHLLYMIFQVQEVLKNPKQNK